MVFKRFEIRDFYRSPEGEMDFTYIPFDTRGEAIEYIMAHAECDESWLCKITLGSDWDSCERLSTCGEIRKLVECGVIPR